MELESKLENPEAKSTRAPAPRTQSAGTILRASRRERRTRVPRASGSFLGIPLSPDRQKSKSGRLRKDDRSKSTTTLLHVPPLPPSARGSSDQEGTHESRSNSFLRLLSTPGRKRHGPSPESTVRYPRHRRLSQSLESPPRGEGAEDSHFGTIQIRVPGEQMVLHVPIHAEMSVRQIKQMALSQLFKRCHASEKGALEERMAHCHFWEEICLDENERPFERDLARRVRGQFVLHDAQQQSWAVLPFDGEPPSTSTSGMEDASSDISRPLSESEEPSDLTTSGPLDSPHAPHLLLPARMGETFTRCQEPILEILTKRVDILTEERDQLRALLAKNSHRKKHTGSRGRKITLDGERVEVHSKLAETGGSSARVWSVLVDGWTCALKELRYDEVSFDLDAHVGFLNEVKFLSTLPPHPNIIRYLFHEPSTDSMRLFLESYDGTLGEFLRRRRRNHSFSHSGGEEDQGALAPPSPRKLLYQPRELQRFLLDIASGLDFLHSHHIIHRDLKSDNIFVRLNRTNDIQRLVIGDFDTCKNMKNLDVTRTLVGTPSCIAPEVLNSTTGTGYTYPVDIYSFGILIFELLTLSRPYDGLKLFEIACHIRDGRRPVIPAYVDRDHYGPFIELYHDMTSFDPIQRPDSTTVLERLKSLFIY